MKNILKSKKLKSLVLLLSIFAAAVCGGCSDAAVDDNALAADNNASEQSSEKDSEANVYDSTEAFDYAEYEDGVTITLFHNPDYVEYDKIIVPESIDGKKVLGIGALEESDYNYGMVFAAVFGDCEVVIPDTVEFIGGEAFFGAKGLTKVTIGKNCKVIGDGAFHCDNLKEITVPDGVTKIGYAFSGALTEIHIPSSVTFIGSLKKGEEENIFNNYDRETDCTIYAPEGSYAEQYANKYGIPFEAEQ